MCYVIGGNMREAEDFIRRKQLVGSAAIDDPRLLEWIRDPDVILTGTFIARANVQAFYDALDINSAKVRFR